jgi:flagellar basal-body rod protein FlgC
MMNLFGVMEMSGSAMGAQRVRAEVVAANLANAETTRTPSGGPYRRKEVVFGRTGPDFRYELAQHSASVSGVKVRAVVEDPSPPIVRYQPGHPDANADGYVSYPNVNPVTELVDLMSASRSYESNAAAVNAAKQMIVQSLDILR